MTLANGFLMELGDGVCHVRPLSIDALHLRDWLNADWFFIG